MRELLRLRRPLILLNDDAMLERELRIELRVKEPEGGTQDGNGGRVGMGGRGGGGGGGKRGRRVVV